MMDENETSEAEELLTESGIFYIVGEIEETALLDIHQQILLHTLQPHTGSITLIINSVGGSCSEGWALIDLLDWAQLNGTVIRTVGMGNICSMATCILAAGTRGSRLITRNCNLLIHAPSVDWMAGNVHQIADSTRALHIEQERHIRFWQEHSKYSNSEAIKEKFLNRLDVWLKPEEAIEHGIVDGIVGKMKIIPPKVPPTKVPTRGKSKH